MQNMSFVAAKVWTVSILGVTFLIASSGVGHALPKLKGNKTYCDCACVTSSTSKELVWEKVASCSVSGKACSATNSTGQLEPGTLKNCQTCTTGSDGNFNNCVAAGMKLPGGEAIPEPGGMAPPPTTSPKMPGTVAPGMTDPIMRRGIDENVELLPGPPAGADPSAPSSGGKGK